MVAEMVGKLMHKVARLPSFGMHMVEKDELPFVRR